MLHFGLQYAYRDLQDAAVDTRIRSRMGIRGVETNGGNSAGNNGTRSLLVGPLPQKACGRTILFGAVAAHGQWMPSVQGEYLRRTIKADAAAQDINVDGYYAQVAYTLTGEPRIS